MSQILRGTTYSTGDQVTSANLNALVDNAQLLAGAVTDQAALNAVLPSSDQILIARSASLYKATPTTIIQSLAGTQIPSSSSNTGSIGVSAKYAREDHTHINQVINLTGDVTATGTDSLTSKVVAIQNTPVASTTPTQGQVMAFDNGAWRPITQSSGGPVNATQLQGRNISATAPTTGQTLTWDGSQWIPSTGSSPAQIRAYLIARYVGSSVTIDASYNIASVTYDPSFGNGTYTITFSTAIPTEYFVSVTTVSGSKTSTGVIINGGTALQFFIIK